MRKREKLKTPFCSSISIYLGVLTFTDRTAFNNAVVSISKGERILLPNDFVSLSSIYKNVLDSEEVFFKKYARRHESDGINYVDVHSKTYYENKDILLLSDYNGTTVLEMNIFSSAIAELVNRDGLVIIGDNVFVYTKDAIYMSNKHNVAAFKGTISLSDNIKWAQVMSVGGRIRATTACQFCYGDIYKYSTKIFPGIIIYPNTQNIVEYYVTQIRTNIGGLYCQTETQVSTRYRHLKQNPFTGVYTPDVVELYLNSQFSGSRTPGVYYISNGYSNLFAFKGDYTVLHCYDSTSGNGSCFTVYHANSTMYSPEDNTTGTTVSF